MNPGRLPTLHVQVSLRSIAIAFAILLVASWGPIALLSGFVAALGLVTIPILVGFAIRSAHIYARRRPETLELNLRSAFKSWLIGLIAITASASFVSIFLAPIAFDVASLVALIGLAYCLLRGSTVKTVDASLTSQALSSLGILFLGSIVPFWYLRRLAPFPFMLAGDVFVHLIQIGSTLGGVGGVSLWDGGFITMIASSSMLAHSQPLWTFWVGPLFQYLAFSIGIYWLARKYIRNNWVCLASALLPLWFMGDGLVNDLIFLLRPNIILCLIPFAMAISIPGEKHDGEIKVTPIVISGIATLFFFFALSEGVYNSFVTRLPLFLQYLLQPGFIITAPAPTYGLPIAVIQDFYAASISSGLFLVALKLSSAHQRKLLMWWYLITCAGILVEHTISMVLSIVILGLLVLRRYSSSPLPPILSVLGLGGIGLLLAGMQSVYRALQTTLAPVAHILSQGLTDNPLSSLQLRIDFLHSNYGTLILYLYLISLASLSILLWRQDKSARRMAYVSIIGLFLYFSPFPFSYFFFILVTPFVGITIGLVLVRLYSFVNTLGARDPKSIHDSPNSEFAKSLQTRRPMHTNPPKAVFAAAVCVILLIIVPNITQVYDANIDGYKTVYGKSQSLTSFSAQDLSAAEWLKSNFPPTTLIISDPETIEILAALSGLPYTVQGRIVYSGGVTPETDLSLFRSVVTNLSAKSLIDLVGYYRATDRYMGFDSSKLKIMLVVNNRTSWWASGLDNYTFSNSFLAFPGFAAYSNSSFVSSAFNPSATYRIYTLMIPPLGSQAKTHG